MFTRNICIASKKDTTEFEEETRLNLRPYITNNYTMGGKHQKIFYNGSNTKINIKLKMIMLHSVFASRVGSTYNL
ncbi:MAG: hypothetical protein DLM72_05890 [Candidatus Nitrosopolaris wilkensis]|nr:MAG: hypothetical protein DLM72_05890 [Candidatus Nitrosopolaris wilkensis]